LKTDARDFTREWVVFYANDVAAFVAGVARTANQAAEPAIADGLAAPRSGFIAALFNHSSSEVSP